MGSEDIFKMAPDMMADVGVRGPDGRTQHVQGRRHGWVNGRYYYFSPFRPRILDPDSMKRVVIAAGGSGGHFYPGLVLAVTLRTRG